MSRPQEKIRERELKHDTRRDRRPVRRVTTIYPDHIKVEKFYERTNRDAETVQSSPYTTTPDGYTYQDAPTTRHNRDHYQRSPRKNRFEEEANPLYYHETRTPEPRKHYQDAGKSRHYREDTRRRERKTRDEEEEAEKFFTDAANPNGKHYREYRERRERKLRHEEDARAPQYNQQRSPKPWRDPIDDTPKSTHRTRPKASKPHAPPPTPPSTTPALPDYYKALGLKPDASVAGIRKAYLKQIHENHPDRNGGSERAKVRTQELVEAYETLGDAEKRTRYDKLHRLAR